MQPKAVVNYFRLPNALLDYNLKPSELCVIAYLHSVYQAAPQNSLFGGEVSVKQSKIAAACHMSKETVARVIKKLINQGIIISRKRNIRYDKLHGSYTYTLRLFSGNFFFVQRKALPLLSVDEYYVYLWFCKLADKNSRFFQSYNELSLMLGMKRSTVIRLVKSLTAKKLIYKNICLTFEGDYTDNHYTIIYFMRLSIRKKNRRFMRCIERLLPLCEPSKPKLFIDRGGG